MYSAPTTSLSRPGLLSKDNLGSCQNCRKYMSRVKSWNSIVIIYFIALNLLVRKIVILVFLMFYFVSLQPQWVSQSEVDCLYFTKYFKQKHQKEKHIKVPFYYRTCTAVRLYCKTEIEMRNEGMQWKKNNKLKQTNMLVSAGCELVVIDDKCPIIRDLESPISSAVILQICILNWPCSDAAQCTVSGVFTETGLI